MFVPLLVALGIALLLFLLGRGLATRKCTRAMRVSEQLGPASTNFPLNHVDPYPRPVEHEPSDIVFEFVEVEIEDDIDVCDSASATSRFRRAG